MCAVPLAPSSIHMHLWDFEIKERLSSSGEVAPQEAGLEAITFRDDSSKYNRSVD